MRVRGLVVLAFAAFVVLGLPDGTLGVAWPSMAATFRRPLSALGVVLAAGGAGYLAATAANGGLLRRLGTGRHLVVATGTSVAGLALLATTATWVLVVVGAALVGFGGGALDAGLNAYVAVHHGVRTMGLLHASFGLGATLGPLATTAVLRAGASWRVAYGLVLAATAGLAVAIAATRRRWATTPPQDLRTAASAPAAGGPLLVLGLASFFLYTGVEIAAGQWAFSLLSEARGLSTTTAGVWVSAYWGSLTLGRVVLGVAGGRVAPGTLLGGSMVAVVVGSSLLWADPLGAGPAGLVLAGVGLAPIFPTMVTLTPVRLGTERAAAAIGYQLAAGGLGGTVLPALVGVLVDGRGVGVVAPALVAGAAAMAGLHAATARWAGRRHPAGTP